MKLKLNMYLIICVLLAGLLCSCQNADITVIQSSDITASQGGKLYAAVIDIPEVLEQYMQQYPSGQFSTPIPVFSYQDGKADDSGSLFYLPTVEADGQILFYTLITIEQQEVKSFPVSTEITGSIEALRGLTSEESPMILIEDIRTKGNAVSVYAVVGNQAVYLEGVQADSISLKLPQKEAYQIKVIE